MFGFGYGGRVLNNGHIRKSLAVSFPAAVSSEIFNDDARCVALEGSASRAARLKALFRWYEPVMEKTGV